MARPSFAFRVDADSIERAHRLVPTIEAARGAEQIALGGRVSASAVFRLALRRGLDALEAQHAAEGSGR